MLFRARASSFRLPAIDSLVEAVATVPAPATVVVVQVTPEGSAAEHGERLITACTQGLRQGACVLASGAQRDQRSAIVAQVVWRDDFRVVDIKVGTPGSSKGEWIAGKVAFDEQDAPADRWTTAGFTVATLAYDLELPEEPAATPAPVPAPPPPAAPSPEPARPAAQPAGPKQEPPRSPPDRFQVGIGGMVGQGMSDQGLRLGPWLALTYVPASFPLSPRARGSMTFDNADGVDVRWSTLTAGLEFGLPLGEVVTATAAAEGGLSFISASSGAQASRTAGLLCLLLGLEAALGGPLRAVVAGELSVGPATNVTRTDQPDLVDPRTKLGGLAGLELEF